MRGRLPFVGNRTHKGFTLIELMIVVAIVGILAAVAIPVLSGYIQRSKASESFTILQGIRDKEEAYFAEYRRYTSTLLDQPAGGTCASACGAVNWSNARNWDLTNTARGLSWKELGFDPGGPTYYKYQVTTPYSAAGVFNGGVGRPANKGTSWPGVVKPWFMAQACGDLDCDNQPANYYISSANKNAFSEQDGETY